YRRNDDLCIILQKRFLVFIPNLFVESGVVRQRVKSLVAKVGGQGIDRASAEAINYSALVLSFVEIVEQLAVRVSLWLDPVINIRAIKARDKQFRTSDIQPLDDVLADQFVGRRRQC